MNENSGRSHSLTRRTLLRALPVTAALGTTVSTASAEPSRSSRTLLAGTDQATELTVYDSGKPGPTCLVVGGVHGDEEAGWKAATEVADWTVDTGRLVVLSKANVVGVRENSREGPNGDLNRQFPLDDAAETPLARAIWRTVLEFQPDLVVDLHESRGLYSEGGLGQSLGYAPVTSPEDAAGAAVDAVNEVVMHEEWTFDRRLLPSPVESPMGVFVQKAAYELGVPTFIVETWEGLDLTKRVRWQKKVVEALVDHVTEIYEPPTAWQELRVGGTGPETRFTFQAGDEVQATDTLEDTDTVLKHSVEGQVSTLDDSYRVAGGVADFGVVEGDEDDLALTLDGESTSPDALAPRSARTMEIRGGGPECEFQFTVDGTVAGGRDWEDHDVVFENRVFGIVRGLDDYFDFTGDVTTFAVTEGDADDFTIVVDGEVRTVEELNRDAADTKELVVRGTGPVTRFEFGVTGNIYETDTLEDTDTVFDSRVEGQVSTQDDTYRFTGDLDELVVTDGDKGDIAVLVDEQEVAITETGQETSELVVEGSGPVTRFEFVTDGQVEAIDTLEDTDDVDGNRVTGQVSTLDDVYRFTGNLLSFTVVDGEKEDITVTVDGEEIEIEEAGSDSSQLTVEGTGPVTRFAFDVTGTVTGSDLEDTDVVYDSRVEGQVSTQDDYYEYTGEVTSFTVTEGDEDDLVVRIDGTERSIAALDG